MDDKSNRLMWRLVLASVLAVLMSAAPIVRSVTYAASAPAATISWYVTSMDTTWAYNKGCALGAAAYQGTVGQNLVVVLNFFTQSYSSGWGTMYDDHVFHPISQAKAVTTEFAHGFWFCTATNTTARLTLAMGTRNIWWVSQPTTSLFNTYGKAWSQIVSSTQGGLGAFATQVSLAGAIDAETSWASPNYTLAWAQGFSDNGGSVYYNYGDAAGCPSQTYPTWSCNGGYTMANMYSLSYDIAAAYVIPEIYLTDGLQAYQWQWISLWGSQYGRLGRILFSGSFTQYNACTQGGTHSLCTTNAPSAGWTQLWNSVNSDSRTSITALPWSADVRWQQ